MYEWQQLGDTGNYARSGTARMPPGVVSVIGGGTTSLVGVLEDGNILKYPILEDECSKEFEVEVAVYEALGYHPRIIRFLGRTEHGLKLERAIRLTKVLNSTTDVALKLQWARQIAEGLSFLHSRGVIHCDIHPNNLLLDDKMNIKICDFQGTMGKLDGAATEPIRYCLPLSDTPSIKSDIFAFGSTIYKMMTGSDPHHESPDNEVSLRYQQLDFPATNFVAGKQVLKCWRQEYSCADEIVSDLTRIASIVD